MVKPTCRVRTTRNDNKTNNLIAFDEQTASYVRGETVFNNVSVRSERVVFRTFLCVPRTLSYSIKPFDYSVVEDDLYVFIRFDYTRE